MPQQFNKDPQAALDYGIDWETWLDGDTISQSTWAAPAGITILDTPAPSATGTMTTIWLSGGEVGQAYAVTNTIETVAARIDERTITIYVQDK